jgi:sarcosine oxidase subunit alpha
MSGGWSPTVHLTSHLGGRPVWDEAICAFVPDTLPHGLSVAGAAAGRFALPDCLASGAEAGRAAASAAGFRDVAVVVPEAAAEETGLMPLWRVPRSKGKAFVDFQNDVSDKDIELAEREGFRSVEHLKRYTTLGMATDQGKTANVNGLAIMAELRKRTISETGTTTFRPPYSPVAIGALAGRHRGRSFRPTRLTPAHAWAKEQGAVFVETGAWLRAQWFARAGESGWLESVTREVLAVRNGVGLCDVSTLGKIDLQGADAAEFLNRLYINGWSNLAVGKARYGVMLREDGFVFDDGTTSRFAEDHFVMTTTTANAGRVLHHMDYCHQVLWPDLDVQFVSISDHWAQFAVAGPQCRSVLQRVVDAQHDISNEALPYMGAAGISVMGGVPARLFRISFSGELAYEIAAPARHGDALVRALMVAGQDEGITPYGLEALSVMRIEKGHVAGGELNGTTTARDLGLGKMASTKKDFVGRVMSGRAALTDPDRPTLVGVRPVDPAQRISGGAHFLDQGADARMENDLGYLTSAAYSPMLKSWIGLGLIRKGPERIGERLRAWDSVRGRDTVVEVCSPCFYDPSGERLRV